MNSLTYLHKELESRGWTWDDNKQSVYWSSPSGMYKAEPLPNGVVIAIYGTEEVENLEGRFIDLDNEICDIEAPFDRLDKFN